jgi:serine/threonine-protein kinase
MRTPAIIAAVAVPVIAVSGIAAWLLWRSLQPATPGRAQGTSQEVAEKAESGTSVFSPPARSVAVLPFVNMSGDPKQDYFSDGVSEELLNALARLNDLQVVARTSSFSFKGQNVDAATIAHKLNVGSILEGSVRRSGNTVRITAQLINTVTGFHLWSETYDRPFSDIFKVQTEVATAVAQQLEIKLAGNESAKFEVGGTTNPAAYDAYLRALREYQDNDDERGSNRATLEALDQAIALDPNYAAAYAMRSTEQLDSRGVANPDMAKDLGEQALESAERAVALAPDFGAAHAALGRVRRNISLDFIGAGAEYDRALVLAPGSSEVQIGAAIHSALLGHFAPALVGAQRAVNLDPRDWHSYYLQAQILFWARQYGEAIAALQHGQVVKPGAPDLNDLLSTVLFVSGHIEPARQLCEALATPMHENARHSCLALVYHAMGRQADAKHELEALEKLAGDADAFNYAETYAQWGNAPAALQWLAKVEQLRVYGLQFLKVDPLLDPIRNERRFKALLARMKFPP